ncbi:MAG: FimB/Mfa2 family fimbrial subunit [Bacteroidales bacterium]|nr:FimB/Mfa2 family fimbrial subunit [Bacteroidales bacterium]
MKLNLFIIAGFLLFFSFSSCEKEIDDLPEKSDEELTSGNTSADLPDGSFEVTFSTAYNSARAAVSGSDGRVRHLRYIIYKSTGEFVKEKVVVKTTDSTPIWPLSAVKDTLPKGQYTAVFIANVEKSLFPVPGAGGSTNYNEVLTNYKGTIDSARIVLPSTEFSDTSEYYWAKVQFSDTKAQPNVLLQRIIGMLNLHRNFVDAQTALNSLVNNIVTQVGYRNYLQTTVNGLLTDSLKKILDRGPVFNLAYSVVGGLDSAVNIFARNLLVPVTNALYDQLLQNLTNQIGSALAGNATQAGAIAKLGEILNPWGPDSASAAIVTIRNFPKTINFNLEVKDYYVGDHRFKYTFTGGTYDERDVLIRGFGGNFDVRKINAIRRGLIAGLVVDNLVDDYVLYGAFVDITDSVKTAVPDNIRFKRVYSFVSLQLKSYTQQTDGAHRLTLSVKLANIANIDNILSGIPILGPLLNTTLSIILSPIKNITVSVPVNLPLLGIDNLKLSGSWSSPVSY